MTSTHKEELIAPTMDEKDIWALIDDLRVSGVGVDGAQLEAMLATQAQALQCIFAELVRRARYLKDWEPHLRVALKAQSQCRATLETLARVRTPALGPASEHVTVVTGVPHFSQSELVDRSRG